MLADQRKGILLIEDDVDIRETLQDILGAEGYAVYCASNGRDGLRQLRAPRSTLGLCLLDCFLPVMSGEQVLEAMAQQPNEPWAQVPVVLLSAAETRGRVPGRAVGFLRKPVELDELMAVVRQYCD